MMKKLLLITDLFPNRFEPVGGVFVQHQAEELTRHYEVRVVATSFSHAPRIEHGYLGKVKVSTVYFPSWTRFFLTALLTYPIFALPRIASICRAWRPDLIHVHDFRHIPELVWLKVWLDRVRIPRYLSLHNITTHPDNLRGKPHLFLYQMALGKALRGWNHVFTVSASLKDWVSAWLHPEQITVLGNGITPPPPVPAEEISAWRQRLSPNSFKIFSVGYLFAYKGFPYLIQSVRNLVNEGHAIQLVIAGEGEERSALEKLIRDLDLADRVILAGTLPHALVRNLYPLFDAFVLPSYSESFGIVYLEAMYAGLPVVGVNGQGISGLFEEGKEALFCVPRDQNDLDARIRYLIEHPDSARSIGAAGRERVLAAYILEGLISRITAVYEQA